MESNFYFIQIKNKWLKRTSFDKENNRWNYDLVKGWVGHGTGFNSSQIHFLYDTGELRRIAKMYGVGKKNFRIVGFNYVYDDTESFGKSMSELVFSK